MQSGWVYVLTNPAMPGLVKIGLTSRDPQARAAELTQASGVPAPFALAWCRGVADCAAVEAAVHRMLADRRVSGRREFFRCTAKAARQVIETAAGAKLEPPCRPKRTRRERAAARNEPSLLFLIGTSLLVLLMILKPPVPAWLAVPLAQMAAVVRDLR